MHYRLYQPSDENVVRAIFAKQNLAVRLPLPGIDPAVCTAVVGEEDGQVRMALIQRLTVEGHLIIDPEEPNGAKKFRDCQRIAAGATLAIAGEMKRMGFGAPDDVIAFIPENNPRMHELMKTVGFVDEVKGFIPMYRRLGG
jgi:hypothetical protein